MTVRSRSSRGRRPALAVVAFGLAARTLLRRLRAPDLRNRVALVTGGSRGLGLIVARELARAGCRVAICARDADELRAAVTELSGSGTGVIAIRADVGVEGEAEEAVRE